MEEESAGSRSSVDGVGEALELHSLLLQLVDQIDQVLDAPAQTVKFPNHEGVAGTKSFHRLSEARALSPGPAHPVFEDLLAAGLRKSLRLQFEVLVLRCNTRVAGQYARGYAFCLLQLS